MGYDCRNPTNGATALHPFNCRSKDNERSWLANDRQAAALLRIAVLCNDAHLDRADQGGSGDPMEIALLRAGLHAGLRRTALLHGHRIVRKHAFDPASKMMATAHESGDGFLVAVKGAPEAVLAAATRTMVEHREVALDDAMRAECVPTCHTRSGIAAKRESATPTFERKVFNGYLVSQVHDSDCRYLCGTPGHGGTKKLDDAKAIAQADHDAGRDR
jgi:hypothetical protein